MATKRPSTPPPLHQLPTAKEKKYDRQLRLWGASGQEALEDTHILLINNGPGIAGVETLKNLVLPGVGHFTILDPALVSHADLGVNFFLDDTSLGRFRAEETVKLLMELNPDVKGSAVTEPLESFVTRKDSLLPYTLILVAAPIDPSLLDVIQNHAQEVAVPTFYMHSVGFYAHCSVCLPSDFPIVDTHPDPETTSDLRLLSPWPALLEFAKEMAQDVDLMPAEQKAHVPYICLLLHYLDRWKSEHNGQPPQNYKEKTEFRDVVRAGDFNEENFDEAVAAVLKSLNPPTPPSTVRDILATTTSMPPSARTSFWVIAQAVQHFYTSHGQLPLPGGVPDMKAKSNDYIRLQTIYRDKARSDCAEVLGTVREIEQEIGQSNSLAISESEVEAFCKGAAHIALVRGRPFHIVQPGGIASFGDRAKALAVDLSNPESLTPLYISFLAWDQFLATHKSKASESGGEAPRVPGASDLELEGDVEKLTGIAQTMIDNLIRAAGATLEDPDYSISKQNTASICLELTRAGGGELHNVASLLGGMVAQEVIKVITRQYVPIDNTLLFDGVSSRSQVIKV
ncbi:hypothetical protein K431DRAFT_285713 [Polychaeton citri CBS 116435]|uniref:NEDD8-activating enzyme E1 regulatory subunit n=1 Tax=Polychaeton citri CBS 116435 TaxID=1314669 RepID=A0A9P4UPB7_9PEZI|nr:hypothetical protein K431DRAFT_285713 [Polychaeton citri CBS 116435]